MNTKSTKLTNVAIISKAVHSLMAATIFLGNYTFAADTSLTSNVLVHEQSWSSNLFTPSDLDQLRNALTDNTMGSSPQALLISPTLAKQALEGHSDIWGAILEGQPRDIPLTTILESQPLAEWRADDGLDFYVTYDDKNKLDMIVVRPPTANPSQFTIDFSAEVLKQGKTFKQFTTDHSTRFQTLIAQQQSSDKRKVDLGLENPLINDTQNTIGLEGLQNRLRSIHESGDLQSAINVVIGAPDIKKLLSTQKESLGAINRNRPTSIDLSKLADSDVLPPELSVEGLDAYALYDKDGQFRELAFRPWDLDEAEFFNFLPSDWNPVPVIITWGKRVISTTKQTLNVARINAKDWACGLKPAPVQITITVEASIGIGSIGLGGNAGATYEHKDLCG